MQTLMDTNGLTNNNFLNACVKIFSKNEIEESILNTVIREIIRLSVISTLSVYQRKIRNFREYCSQIYLYSDICFSPRGIFKANNILRYVKCLQMSQYTMKLMQISRYLWLFYTKMYLRIHYINRIKVYLKVGRPACNGGELETKIRNSWY